MNWLAALAMSAAAFSWALLVNGRAQRKAAAMAAKVGRC